jgi:hypothetical protein
MLHRVALVRTDVSEELCASPIRVTRIDELGTTLAVTSNRRTDSHSHSPDRLSELITLLQKRKLFSIAYSLEQ